LFHDEFLIEIKVHSHFDDHNHNHNNQHGTDEESLGIDPHFWVDPLTVQAMLPALLNELIKIDPENEEYFRRQ
jgi:zinc transport system substrate-binding protein